jgi:hypothetical protein
MQQATHPRPALEIGYSIADRLTLLHPSRWTAVELTIGRHAEAPIVSAAHVTTDAGPPAATWCDRKAELGLLNRDLAALLHAVQADGGAWDAGALVAERRMSGKLVLSGAPGLRIELAQADLAIGAELLAALARAAPELQARQEALDRAIGPARRVSWSFKDATARFDGLRAGRCKFLVPSRPARNPGVGPGPTPLSPNSPPVSRRYDPSPARSPDRGCSGCRRWLWTRFLPVTSHALRPTASIARYG